MKLIAPLVSITAHCTSSIFAMLWLPRGGGDVLDRHLLAPHALLAWLAVLHHDDGLTVGRKSSGAKCTAVLLDM